MQSIFYLFKYYNFLFSYLLLWVNPKDIIFKLSWFHYIIVFVWCHFMSHSILCCIPLLVLDLFMHFKILVWRFNLARELFTCLFCFFFFSLTPLTVLRVLRLHSPAPREASLELDVILVSWGSRSSVVLRFSYNWLLCHWGTWLNPGRDDTSLCSCPLST